jgi:hypothetical protein
VPLANAWQAIDNPTLKQQTADYISKATHPYDWNSRRGDKAKLVYVNWLQKNNCVEIITQFEDGIDIDFM